MIDVSEVPEDDVKELLIKRVNPNPEGWADVQNSREDKFGLHKRPNKLVSQFKRRRRSGRIGPRVVSVMILRTEMFSSIRTEAE